MADRLGISFGLCAAMVAGLLVAALGPSPAIAGTPTLEQAIAFSRSEISKACSDSQQTRIDAIDHLAIGAGRTCRATLAPGRLKLSVRQRGGAGATDYARLWLDVRFDRESRFICGPAGPGKKATLFITCDADNIVDGEACAFRKVTLARPGRDDYHAQSDLASLALFRLKEGSCLMIARSLNFIGARTKIAPKLKIREYFTARR